MQKDHTALLNAMRKVAPRMRMINLFSIVIAVVLTVATLAVLNNVLRVYAQARAANDDYQQCQEAASNLMETSDFLTTQARLYITANDLSALEYYTAELQVHDRRAKSLEVLREHATSERAIQALESARAKSDELANIELYALRLAAESRNLQSMPIALGNVTLEPADARLSAESKLAKADALTTDSDYTAAKLNIRDLVQTCSTLLSESLSANVTDANSHLQLLMVILNVSVVCLLLVVVFVIVSTTFLLLWPISMHEQSIRDDKPLVPGGALELRTLVDAYNEMYHKNHDKTESLNYEAHYDALTGVLNRGSFDELIVRHRHDSALLLVDIDLFKHFNDDYGHDMGDAILIEVSATLYASFRSTDHICRIGGDEFAVIMTNAHANLQSVIAHKIDKVAAFLRDTSNGLPSVTISVGIAFGDANSTEDELFRKADEALYQTKRRGRDGYTFAA